MKMHEKSTKYRNDYRNNHNICKYYVDFYKFLCNNNDNKARGNKFVSKEFN